MASIHNQTTTEAEARLINVSAERGYFALHGASG